jgi:DNA (cytosine-5)-methyltransferase 1
VQKNWREYDYSYRPSETRGEIVAYAESRKSGEQESRNRREGIGRGSEKVIEGNKWNSEWWAVEPDVGRVANGIPNRMDRLKCLGNAVVPQQVYPILAAIAELEIGGL